MKPPRMPKGKVAARIVALLRKHARERFTPKRMAALLGLPTGTVSKEAWRLANRPPNDHWPVIVADGSGGYRAYRDEWVVSQIEEPPVKLHAIQIMCKLPVNRRSPAPVPATEWGDLAPVPDWRPHGVNTGRTRTELWEGRQVSIQHYPSTGTVLVSLDAAKPKLALLPEEFGRFCGWVGVWMQGAGLAWSPKRARLLNVELHRDYERVAMSEVNRMSLQKFRNSWSQLYQKGDVMRAEIRYLADEVLTLPEAIGLLDALQRPPRVDREPKEPGMEVA